MIRVVDSGVFTTVQDLGRFGLAHMGVPTSGAADRGSLRLGNRLVGNVENAAALECTLSGPILEFNARSVVALTGAPVAARANGRLVDMFVPTHVEAGTVLQVGVARAGLRTYLCVSGGIDVPITLGSRSTDTLSGLGPPPLATGVTLPVGKAATAPWAGVDVIPHTDPPSHVLATLSLGPRQESLSAEALAQLGSTTFVVSPTSNRIGVRLSADPLERQFNGELRSEGLISGAVQVPPSGHPIIMLADHPTTGGYPVVGCIPGRDVDKVAQLRPGDTIAFRVARAGW